MTRRSCGPRGGRSRGFTLIELMVVVAIVGVMATLAVGMNGSWRRRQDFKELTREVYNAITIAHAEALRRGGKVHVAVTSTSITAFIDAKDDHAYEAGEELIYNYPPSGTALSAGMSLSSSTLTAVGSTRVTVFDARGFAVNPADLASLKAGSIVLQDTSLPQTATVEFTIAGAAHVLP